MQTTPFEIRVDDGVLTDLEQRLRHTRWPDQIVRTPWEDGTDSVVLRDLAEYWRDGYDWRRAENELNRFAHFRGTVGDLGLHFVHETSAAGDAMPLLLLHGWPSSFVQMQRIVPMLTHVERSGQPFHVVVPSLPGYAFSDRPTEPGMSVARVADYLHRLMQGLGYERYVVRATDLGAGVATQLALTRPHAVVAVHTSGTNPFVPVVPDDLSPAEQEFVDNAQAWMQTEMAYAMLHSSKPQTLAHALNDSPVGLASWILEKFWRWGDHDGDVAATFGRDDLLTNINIYWATQTIGSSMRLYYETVRDPGQWGRVGVPTAALQFSGDMFPTPREWAERTTNIVRWTEAGRGGHFPEWERPDAVAADLREFVASMC